MAETRADTLTEPRRMSQRNVPRPNYEELDGGREDDSESDSEKESRATKGCLVSTDKGINGTVSEAVSSVKRPRRMKRKASVMWSRSSSSSSDDDEAEGTERRKFKKGRRHEGRNLRRGHLFCDEAYYTLQYSRPWVHEVYGDIYNTRDLGFKG